MTSICSQSAPQSIIRLASFARSAKSDDNIDGATIISGMIYIGEIEGGIISELLKNHTDRFLDDINSDLCIYLRGVIAIFGIDQEI